MSNTFQIYLISDSTGETLDRIFSALKAQFKNIDYKINSYSFTRTENQILKILEDAEKKISPIILYTIVDNKLAKYLANQTAFFLAAIGCLHDKSNVDKSQSSIDVLFSGMYT